MVVYDAPAPPARMGRYRILGRLAKGGMAEILLATVDGPAHFERLVVLKRVAPHLAHDPRFRTMFLDEARLLARIHHPNVVQLHELVDENGQLFLTMEYLEGETAAGLQRRLQRTGDKLDPLLAIHIAAETCRGLHAAHELRGVDGNLVDLVHRDVSPSNVLITYAGTVKLIDFGIALGKGRTAATEAGQLKGKFSYMAPEQCAGQALDRRTDIFAMGAVLFELGTGVRLFQRETDFLTMRAVCEEQVPPPSQLRQDLPAGFDAACLRALSRNPNQRFADAAEMRSELVEILATAGVMGTIEQQLAELMTRLFGDRRREKMAFREAQHDLTSSVSVPAGEVDQDVELPKVTEVTRTFHRGEESNDVGASSPQPVALAADQPPSSPALGGQRVGLGVALAIAIIAVGLTTRVVLYGSAAEASPQLSRFFPNGVPRPMQSVQVVPNVSSSPALSSATAVPTKPSAGVGPKRPSTKATVRPGIVATARPGIVNVDDPRP